MGINANITHLVNLVGSIPQIEGKSPYRFLVTKDSLIANIAAISTVVTKNGGCEEIEALHYASSILNSNHGCMTLPKSNVFWWRDNPVEDTVDKNWIFVVFVKSIPFS